MARMRSLRRAAALASVLLAVVAAAGIWWAVSGAPAVTTEAASVTVAPDASCDMSVAASVDRRPCKPCKDRPWCECTYNGAPRISCNPCCYDTQPYPTCMD